MSNVSTNSEFVLQETKTLSDMIEDLGLYRRKNFLYDPDFFRPRYSITGFVWGFCKCPSVANQVSENLKHGKYALQDIHDCTCISALEISKLICQLMKNNTKLCGLKQKANLANIFWIFLQKKVWEKLVASQNKTLVQTTKDKLRHFYFEDNWQPAKSFYKSLFKKEIEQKYFCYECQRKHKQSKMQKYDCSVCGGRKCNIHTDININFYCEDCKKKNICNDCVGMRKCCERILQGNIQI